MKHRVTNTHTRPLNIWHGGLAICLEPGRPIELDMHPFKASAITAYGVVTCEPMSGQLSPVALHSDDMSELLSDPLIKDFLPDDPKQDAASGDEPHDNPAEAVSAESGEETP